MRFLKFIRFLLFYLMEILLSNFRVAYDVITPSHYMSPGFIAIPLEDLTDLQLMILTNMITMTPGTLSLDVSSDRKTLYIHAMYIDEDIKKFKNELVRNYIMKIKEVF